MQPLGAHLHSVAAVDRLLAGIDGGVFRMEALRDQALPVPEGNGGDESCAAPVMRRRDLLQYEAVDRGEPVARAVLETQLDRVHVGLGLPEEENTARAAQEPT